MTKGGEKGGGGEGRKKKKVKDKKKMRKKGKQKNEKVGEWQMNKIKREGDGFMGLVERGY